MNWKPLFLLLSMSAVIVPFDLRFKAFADTRVKELIADGATIDYGYLTFTEPSISISSYARSNKSKTFSGLQLQIKTR